MLFKFFTVGALIYILYRISAVPRLLENTSNNNEKNIDESDYVDYEEVE